MNCSIAHLEQGQPVTIVFRYRTESRTICGHFVGHAHGAVVVQAERKRLATLISERDLVSITPLTSTAATAAGR